MRSNASRTCEGTPFQLNTAPTRFRCLDLQLFQPVLFQELWPSAPNDFVRRDSLGSSGGSFAWSSSSFRARSGQACARSRESISSIKHSLFGTNSSNSTVCSHDDQQRIGRALGVPSPAPRPARAILARRRMASGGLNCGFDHATAKVPSRRNESNPSELNKQAQQHRLGFAPLRREEPDRPQSPSETG